jgi:hypothetical protein
VKQPRLSAIRIHGRSYNQAATRDAQIERLKQVGFRLEKDVAANYAAVSNTVLDVDRDVSGLYQNNAKATRLVFESKSTRSEVIAVKPGARALEKSKRLVL